MVGSGHAAALVAPERAWRRVVAGVTMLVLATALATHGLAVPAGAQEFGDGAGGGAADGTTEELEITELTLYASSLADIVPGTLRTGVPPAVVCVVANEAGICPESTAPLRDALSEGFNTFLDSVPAEPFHPVPPDSAAISVLFGADRYQSAIRFEPPAIPGGQEFTTFQLRFPTALPSFDANSPSFRRVILGLFSTLAENNDPSFFFEGLQAALTEEEPLEINEDILGIEACPFTQAFEPGGPPAAQYADEDLPRDEEFGDVAVDCVLGSNAQLDAESGDWLLDLTFAANAWLEGDLENFGVLLRPTGVNNLAFGDPDVTTSGQVTLDTSEVTVTFASAEPPPPPPPLEDLGGFDEGGFDDGFEDGFDLAADDFQEMGGFEPGPAIGGPMDAGPPAVADAPDGAEAPMAADGGQQQILNAAPVRGEPINPWWLWLLVPLFGGGGYLVSAPLLAPTSAGGTATPGALSRLLARRGVAAA